MGARVTTSSMRARTLYPGVLVFTGGLVIGTFDIVYACIFWFVKAGVPAQRILQSVAAGVLGPSSFQGGAATASLGIVLHYLIAMTMSVAYYLVATRLSWLHERPVLYGAVYGLILYAIMSFVVVPLSAAPPGSTDAVWVVLSVAVHAFAIGVPIAFFGQFAHRAQIAIP